MESTWGAKFTVIVVQWLIERMSILGFKPAAITGLKLCAIKTKKFGLRVKRALFSNLLSN